MSKCSELVSLCARSAPVSAVLLVGALACSSTSDPGPAAAGSGNSVAGAASSMAGSGVAGTMNVAGAAGSGLAGSGGTMSALGGSGGAAAGSAGTLATGGASGGAGGSGGATTAGAGGAAGGGSADCSAFKLCDGFEGDAPGKGMSPWTAMGGTAIEVTKDQHHGGTQSVHITAPNTSGFSALIQEKKTFPATEFWGRAFLRFKGDGGGHQMYIAVNLPGDQLRLLNRLGSDNAQVNFQKSDKFYNTNHKIVQETWFCYEWHVTASAVNIFIDGQAQTTSPAIPGITGGTTLSLGYTRYATGSAAGEMWIDDVAVNDTQIGCQ